MSNLNDPAFGAYPIVPHATNPIAAGTRAIYVGGAGNVVCKLIGSDADVTVVANAGDILPFRISHVRATSTATAMLALT